MSETIEVIELARETKNSPTEAAPENNPKKRPSLASRSRNTFKTTSGNTTSGNTTSGNRHISDDTFSRIISKRDKLNTLPTSGNSEAMMAANILAAKTPVETPVSVTDESHTVPKLAAAPTAPMRPRVATDDTETDQDKLSPRAKAAIELAALGNLIPYFAFNSFYNKDTLNEPDRDNKQTPMASNSETIGAMSNLSKPVPSFNDGQAGMEKIEPEKIIPEMDSAVQEMKLLVSMVREIDTIRSRVTNLGLLEESLPDYEAVSSALDNKDFKTLVLALDNHRSALRKIPFKPPMLYFYISSNYGYRKHPVTKNKVFHHGIDLAGTWQEDILVSAPGVVTFAGRAGSFGNVVRVSHAFGVETVFAHLSKIRVKKGQDVSEGTVIGNMGRTGRTEGAHLHYEVRVNGKSLNPQLFFDVGRAMSVSGELRVVANDS
jgi:hypothetical protein